MNEFGFIRDRLAALSRGFPGALDLKDDAALLACGPDEELVLTQDTLVAGVHFLETDPADCVARKALRVNLSDLAAMGAMPVAVMSSVAWPKEGGEALREAWVEGLGWVGFDPSNRISPDDRYVRLAVGRDYDEAAPMGGVRYGAHAEDLHVHLHVGEQ